MGGHVFPSLVTQTAFSNRVVTKWINVVWCASTPSAAFAEEWCRHVYLSGTNHQDQEHLEDIHPGLWTCCFLSHYTKREGAQSCQYLCYLVSSILTIVMNFLCFDLWCYVHRDFVQLELEILDLSADFINRAGCCFVLVVLIRLGNQEVDFLRFTVKLLPAEFEFFLVSGFQLHFSCSISFNPLLLFFALVSLKDEK